MNSWAETLIHCRRQGTRVFLVGPLLTPTTDYKKLGKAYSYLRDDPNVHFLLTNQDRVFPTSGTTYPGTYTVWHVGAAGGIGGWQ